MSSQKLKHLVPPEPFLPPGTMGLGPGTGREVRPPRGGLADVPGCRPDTEHDIKSPRCVDQSQPLLTAGDCLEHQPPTASEGDASDRRCSPTQRTCASRGHARHALHVSPPTAAPSLSAPANSGLTSVPLNRESEAVQGRP